MIFFIRNKHWYKYAEIAVGCILGAITVIVLLVKTLS